MRTDSSLSISREDAADDDNSQTLPYGMLLELHVNDTETIHELQHFPEGDERDRFALDALRIGVLALKQARGEIDADKVRREGERILELMQKQLGHHSEAVYDRIANQLKDYFDPESGRFNERIRRLIEQDGELEGLLRRQIGQQDSELAKTLASHLGQESPLLKTLDPGQSEGIVSVLKQLVEDQLAQQRERILNEFSLDKKEGALSRFIDQLNVQQGELTGELNEKIDAAVKEFSLDDENSALSRLVRNVTDAQRTITNEFSLDEDRSALSRLKKILENTNESIDKHLSLDDDASALARLKRELTQLLKEQQEASQKFQEEVKVTLEAMQVRKQEMERGTRHGEVFEDAVFEFLQFESQKAGDIATHTGNNTGNIKNCKVGDCTIELGPESAAPGGIIVVESKQDGSYQLQKAREEIETARNNRSAQIGLFIFSKRTAPTALEQVSRIGNDVFAVWDADDSNSDLILRVGLTLAKALCVRKNRSAASQQADFSEIDKAILEIEKRTGQLDDMETWTTTIASNSEKILKRINAMRKSLVNQTETLREKTDALKTITESI